MAYTIQILFGGAEKRDKVLAALQERIAKDGRFRCKLEASWERLSREDKRIAGYHDALGTLRLLAETGMSKAPDWVDGIRISKVRLTQKKPYCGNHPGPCPADGKPKPNSTLLEWEDWVAFHALVNRTLNRFRTRANVFTLPYDVKGRMWIRKNDKARVRWDYEEQARPGFMVPLRIWNQGTPDQFEAA